MIKLYLENYTITPHSEALLNAVVKTALPTGLDIDVSKFNWELSFLLGTSLSAMVPTIRGTSDADQPYVTATPKFIIHTSEDFMELTSMTLDGLIFEKPIVYNITPLSEIYVLSNLEENKPDNTRKPQSQLSACSNLIREMYSNDEDYDIDKPVPKVFFTKMDLDYYLGNLAVTLEESILLWMESTGKLSVNMDDEAINMPRLLGKSIKRVFMFGPARNKVKVEFNNGDKKDFSQMTPSAQVEICSEILSILPD